jgi:glycosyltransferase involved in cell wall biosynthesis
MASGFLRKIKRRLERYKPYLLAREIKWMVEKSFQPEAAEFQVATLKPQGRSRGNVLLSYIIDPFLLAEDQPVSSAHTHDWESLQIAKTFLELGYYVDVISYKNVKFQPEKDYTIFIDARYNLERLAPLLPKACIKIMHIDSSHMVYHDAAEARRLLELQQRRGVTLRPRRWEMPNLAIEHADCATILGNEFTMSTFRYAKKPLYRIPISTPVLYPWPEGKNFDGCRRRFLWLGSGGMVHKGVDLILEAFAQMPDHHLTICGPVREEKDFESAYYKELYKMPNIHTFGWIDVTRPEFVETATNCATLIYPSCSEGQAGSVVTCLHAGLIPIVSQQSGVDVNDFGLVLRECSIAEIKNAVRTVSELPCQELQMRARKAWEFARNHHTREKFAEAYRGAALKILAAYGSRRADE